MKSIVHYVGFSFGSLPSPKDEAVKAGKAVKCIPGTFLPRSLVPSSIKDGEETKKCKKTEWDVEKIMPAHPFTPLQPLLCCAPLLESERGKNRHSLLFFDLGRFDFVPSAVAEIGSTPEPTHQTFYPGLEKWETEKIYCSVAEKLIHHHFFSELRTTKELGYDVRTYFKVYRHKFREQRTFNFVIESTVQDCKTVMAEIETFIATRIPTCLNKEEFMETLAAERNQLLEPYTKPIELAAELLNSVLRNTPDLDSRKFLLDLLDQGKVTWTGFLDFVNTMLASPMHRLQIE